MLDVTTTTGISAIYAHAGIFAFEPEIAHARALGEGGGDQAGVVLSDLDAGLGQRKAAAAERLQDMAGKGGLFLPVPSGTGALIRELLACGEREQKIAITTTRSLLRALRQDEPENQD
jgi:hypothetical protein